MDAIIKRLSGKILSWAIPVLLGLANPCFANNRDHFDAGVVIESIKYFDVVHERRENFEYFGDRGDSWSKPAVVDVKVGVKNCGNVPGRVEVRLAMYALHEREEPGHFLGLGQKLGYAQELNELADRPVWIWQRMLDSKSVFLEKQQYVEIGFNNVDISDIYSPTSYLKHGFLLRALLVPMMAMDSNIANNSDERVYLYEDSGLPINNPVSVLCPKSL